MPESIERTGIVLDLDRFAGEALAEEADRLGASVEQLATFAVLYYLADLDSGRIARATQSATPASGAGGDPESSLVAELRPQGLSPAAMQAADPALAPARKPCDIGGREPAEVAQHKHLVLVEGQLCKHLSQGIDPSAAPNLREHPKAES